MHSLQDTLFFLLPPFTAWLVGWALSFAFRLSARTIAIARFAGAGALSTAAVVIVVDTLQGHSATAITAGFAGGIVVTLLIAHVLSNRSTPSFALAGIEAFALGSLISAWHIRSGTQGVLVIFGVSLRMLAVSATVSASLLNWSRSGVSSAALGLMFVVAGLVVLPLVAPRPHGITDMLLAGLVALALLVPAEEIISPPHVGQRRWLAAAFVIGVAAGGVLHWFGHLGGTDAGAAK